MLFGKNSIAYSAVRIRRTLGMPDGSIHENIGGSGVAFMLPVLGADTVLVTCRHVVDQSLTSRRYVGSKLLRLWIEVRLPDGQTSLVSIEINDEERDLCRWSEDGVVAVNLAHERDDVLFWQGLSEGQQYSGHQMPLALEPTFLTAKAENLEPGDRVTVLGHPKIPALREGHPIASAGIIAAGPIVDVIENPPSQTHRILYQSFSTVGMSGGPVFSSREFDRPQRLIGINAGHLEAEEHSGYSYMYGIQAVLAALDEVLKRPIETEWAGSLNRDQRDTFVDELYRRQASTIGRSVDELRAVATDLGFPDA